MKQIKEWFNSEGTLILSAEVNEAGLKNGITIQYSSEGYLVWVCDFENEKRKNLWEYYGYKGMNGTLTFIFE